MIKTKELRVGNYVTINNGFEMLVHSIFQHDTVYLDFIPPLINEADMWEEDFKDINPIQITEDILFKLGFKDKGFGDFKKGAIRLSRESKKHFVTNGFFVEIEYVHQLQNLYFAVTGEDLVFSTEP